MRKYFIISSIAFINITAVLLLLWFPLTDYEAKAQGDLFKGDHITIDLNITEYGKTIELIEPQMVCSSDANESEQVTYVNGLFKTKGGKYGCYSFSLEIPAKALETYSEDLI